MQRIIRATPRPKYLRDIAESNGSKLWKKMLKVIIAHIEFLTSIFELSTGLYESLFRQNRQKLIFLQFIGDTITAIGWNIANINQVLRAMQFWGKKN